MTSIEQRFKSAIDLINQLPKSGGFKPSIDMKLQMYAYYKQATEGPNQANKPQFFDVISKQKWEAWTKLGQMSKEEAMAGYVDIFMSQLKTMTLKDEDSNVFEKMVPFKEFLSPESRQVLAKHNF